MWASTGEAVEVVDGLQLTMNALINFELFLAGLCDHELAN